jgi:hypothetical protein
MIPWTEGNFLERLMPQLRRENGIQMVPCPDSEVLSAFMEDQVSPVVRDSIATHLTQCPKCHDIYERLEQFAKANVPAQNQEWINAEKRLDNWMGGFLHTQFEKTGSKLNVESSLVPRRKDIEKATLSLKLGWAMAMAAVLTFGVGGVVLTRRGPAGSTPVQIVKNQVPPPPRPVNSAPPVLENSAQTNDSANGGAKVSKSEQQRRSAISNARVLRKSPPEASAEAARPDAALPLPPSGAVTDGTSQVAQSHGPPPPLDSNHRSGSSIVGGGGISSASRGPAQVLPHKTNSVESSFPASTQAVSLQEQLAAQYKLAKIRSDTSGYSVVEEGTQLAIQKGGILAVPYSDSSDVKSKYQDGAIKGPGGLAEVGRKSIMGRFGKEQTTHLFAKGDKVYPTKIDVDVSKDNVTLGIVSCDTYNKADPPTYNKAEVVFEFPKGSLANATADSVQKVIAQVFTVSKDDSKDDKGDKKDNRSGQQQAAGQDQGRPQGGDQAAADTVSIEKGMSQDDVEAAMGKPDKKVTLGTKQIYYYKDRKVIFVNGKVSDVQ